jgi:ribosome-dependent ATPase
MNTARLLALLARECLEVWRDPFRLTSAVVVPAVLMIVFGFGLTLDVENLPYATFDRDNSPASRSYLDPFAHSRYFAFKGVAQSDRDLEQRFAAGDFALAIEIPPGFGRDLAAGRTPETAFWIDGTMPFRADTIRGYVEAMNLGLLARYARETYGVAAPDSPAGIETRFWYNQDLKSKFAFVPGVMAAVLALSATMLTAVAVVREKELGSIINLYATPLRRLEFLLGKQLPYVAISMVNFAIMTLMTIALFQVPLKGSGLALAFGALLYALTGTALGLLVSAFTRTQVAAVIISCIITIVPSFLYSGLLTPVSSLAGNAALIARIFPATYFLDIAVGCFTKGLGARDLLSNYVVLGAAFLVLIGASAALLRKQER